MKRISTATNLPRARRDPDVLSFVLRLGAATVSCLVVVGSLTTRVAACPLCLAPSQTWAEMIGEADVVLLAELVVADEGSASRKPFSMVRVVKVHKGKKLLPEQDLFRVDSFIFADKGDLVLLKASLQDVNSGINETFATDTNERDASPPVTIQKVSATEVLDSASAAATKQILVWDFAEKTSQIAFDYVTQSPVLILQTTQRLPHFLSFLEHSDPLVATDAWSEFANAEYKDIKSVSENFSPDDLRKWIADPDTSPERVGLYGLMLGMCSTPQDAKFLQQQIGQPDGEIRFGIEGLMGGYLLLAGQDGLKFLEDSRLKNQQVSSYDCLPVIQALQFTWNYEPDLFEKERLRQALHPLLRHEGVREIVIRDLSRWEDWNAVALLPDVYRASKKSDDMHTVRAILGFVITCRQSGQPDDMNVKAATKLLETIREHDARLVRSMEAELSP